MYIAFVQYTLNLSWEVANKALFCIRQMAFTVWEHLFNINHWASPMWSAVLTLNRWNIFVLLCARCAAQCCVVLPLRLKFSVKHVHRAAMIETNFFIVWCSVSIDDWSSQLYTDLKKLWNWSLENIQAWTGFEPMTSTIPVQCSTDWAIKQSGSWSLCEFVIYL